MVFIKTIKRTIAYLLSILVVLSSVAICIGTIIVTSADTSNLIKDGGFESGNFVAAANKFDGWVAVENVDFLRMNQSEKRSGSYCVAIQQYKQGIWTSFNLENGKTYVLKLYHKGSKATVDVATSWANHISGNCVLGLQTFNNDSSYEEYSYKFTSKVSGEARLYINNNNGDSSGWVWFDDVSITLDEDNTESEIKSLIADSSFESGTFNIDSTKGWKQVEGSSIQTSDKVTGSYGLKINAMSAGVVTTVKLESEKSYSLSLLHKGEAKPTVALASSEDQTVILRERHLKSDDVFTVYSYDFVSNVDGNADLIISNTDNKTSYFDDVVLVENPIDANKDYAELIPDAGFESGSLKEDAKQGFCDIAGSSLVSNIKNSGAFALKIADWQLGVKTNVYLVKGNKYDLTITHKGKEGSQIDISSSWSVHLSNPDVLERTTFANDEEYKKYTFSFEAEITGYVFIYLSNENVDTNSYFDDISLKIHNDFEENLVPDGSFVKGFLSKDNRKYGWAAESPFSCSLIEDRLVNDASLLITGRGKLNGVSTELDDLLFGKEYEISFYHKGNANAKIDISSSYDKHKNGPDILDNIVTKSNDDFEKYSIKFTYNQKNTAPVYLYIQNSENSDSYFKNFSIHLTDNPKNLEYISNPDLEVEAFADDSTLGWNETGGSGNAGAYFDNINTFNNKSTIKILDWKMGVNTTFELKANTEYVLSFYHKAEGKGATVDISTSWSYHVSNPDILSKKVLEADEDFTKYTYVFTSYKKCFATLYFSNTTASPFSWFAGFTLCEKEKTGTKFAFERSAVKAENRTKSSLTISFDNISYPQKANVDYEVYCSIEKITEENIKNLSVVAETSSTSEKPTVKIDHLKEATLYYFAITAKDSSGNFGTCFTTVPVKTKVTPELKNPSFETADFTGWENLFEPQSQVKDYVVYDQNYSLVLRDWSTGVLQKVEVTPQTKYIFSFFGYHPTGTMRLRILNKWAGNILAEQTVDDHYEFKKYTVEFETDENTKSVVIYFDNLRANEEGKCPIGYVDKCFLKEKENENFYFDSDISKIDGSSDYLSISFPKICTDENEENVVYKLYRSKSIINESNIYFLTPIETFSNVKEDVVQKDKDLEPSTNYYYAVMAIDNKGNSDLIFSDCLKTEIEEERAISKKKTLTEILDNDYEDEDEEEIEYIIKKDKKKRYEKIPIQRKKTTVSRKLISADYTIEIILSIIGGIIVIAFVTTFILIKRRKKNAK